MTSTAARLGALERVRTGLAAVGDLAARRPRRVAVPAAIAALAVLMGLSLLLRTRALLAGFWIDEGLSVGIASHPLTDIPSVLRLDGSPPLYYMLLHVWISIFGNGEGETHGMSVGFALLTIPAGFWAARSLGGPRAGWMAAIVAALHPFLTYYAQETRMYALAVLLSMLATTCFIHAYALRDRRFIAPFAIVAALLIYTHNWGLFLLAGTVAALALILRKAPDRKPLLRDAALGYGALALLYVPWVPTLLFQSEHTGAPWSSAPNLDKIIGAALTALGGARSGPLILLVAGAGVLALMGRPLRIRGTELSEEMPGPHGDRRRRAVETLVVVLLVGLVVAWIGSQVAPAWTTRYFSVIVGPAIVFTGIGLAHARGLGIAALVILALMWLGDRAGELNAKSNVRQVAQRVLLRPVAPGDLVLSTHPEQVPVLHYYLGGGFRYADPMGFVSDPTVMDWRDALARLRASRPTPVADELVSSLKPGQALILVQPILRAYYAWRAPWTALVKRRAIQWERVLQRDPRLRRVEGLPRFGLSQPPRGVRVVLYRRR
jgi:mannosyltransferase